MFWNLKFFRGAKKQKRDIKLVCFDIDNTLCDYSSAETETEAHIIKLIAEDMTKIQSRLKKKDVHDVYSSFKIMKIFNEVKSSNMREGLTPEKFSRESWFKQMFERLDIDSNLGIGMDVLIKNSGLYEKKYWEYFSKSAKNYPNTILMLESLKSRGLILASISDSDGKLGIKADRIKHLGLGKYFDYILTGDDIGLNKPAVEFWNRLMELSGIGPKNCMMVGDHPELDLITAKKLGFVTVWTKQQFNTDLHLKYVDYEIHDISEVSKIVENMDK